MLCVICALFCFGGLATTLDKCRLLLAKYEGSKSQSWSTHVEVSNQSWDVSRGHIFQYVLEEMRADLGNCHHCLRNPAVLKCSSCMKGKSHYCTDCDATEHRLKPLHDRTASYNGCLQPVSPYVTVENGAFKEVRELRVFFALSTLYYLVRINLLLRRALHIIVLHAMQQCVNIYCDCHKI